MAFIGGAGIILMVVGLGYGVAEPEANPTAVGGLVLLGALALAFGIGGWVIQTKPASHFDDINVPKDIHTEESHDAHDAIVVASPTAIEPHAPSHS
jgi:hypothetical protein